MPPRQAAPSSPCPFRVRRSALTAREQARRQSQGNATALVATITDRGDGRWLRNLDGPSGDRPSGHAPGVGGARRGGPLRPLCLTGRLGHLAGGDARPLPRSDRSAGPSGADNPRMSLSKNDMTGEPLRSTSWHYAAEDANVAADEAVLG